MFSCLCIFQWLGSWFTTIHGCTELEKTVLEQWHVFFLQCTLRWDKSNTRMRDTCTLKGSPAHSVIFFLPFSFHPFAVSDCSWTTALLAWGISWRTLNPATSWPVEGQSNWRAKILAHESNWAYQFSNTKSYHCLEACILFFRKSRMISQWCLSVLNCFFKDYFFSLTKCTCLNKSNTVFLGWDKVIYKGDFIFHFHYFI